VCGRGAGLWRGVDGGADGDGGRGGGAGGRSWPRGAGDRRGRARTDERSAALETMTRRRRR